MRTKGINVARANDHSSGKRKPLRRKPRVDSVATRCISYKLDADGNKVGVTVFDSGSAPRDTHYDRSVARAAQYDREVAVAQRKQQVGTFGEGRKI